MGLEITILGSGSSGNATLVSDGETHVLVDVGIERTGNGATAQGMRFGAGPYLGHRHLARARRSLPGSGPVREEPRASRCSSPPTRWLPPASSSSRGGSSGSESGVPFDINGILFTPFDIPHDAADPIAFTIERRGVKAGIVVDLGYISNLVVERLRGCDCIVLESNHDLQMLRVGPYPWALKQRVMSRRGHLSNETVARYLANEFDGRARHVVLAHLSQKNNLPELALESARRALEERAMLLCNQTRLEMAGPDAVSKTYSY